jgi:hypothetical protein
MRRWLRALRQCHQWSSSAFALTADPEDARRGSNYALRWVCSDGQLAAAQWLTATLGGAEDARSCDNLPLRGSCVGTGTSW